MDRFEKWNTAACRHCVSDCQELVQLRNILARALSIYQSADSGADALIT